MFAPLAAAAALVLLSSQAGPVVPPETSSNEPVRVALPPPHYMDSVLGLIRHGRYDEARSMLEPVLAGHPDWGRAQFYMALTYHKQHRYEQARPLFERAAALDPDYAPQRVYHGWCLYYLGELEAARAQFNAFLAARPDYPDAIYALGLIDFDDDAIPEARARFERAASLASQAQDVETEAKARARLADVHVREDRLEAAKAELERSIALDPTNYEPYYKLAYVLERLGDSAGAAKARARHEEVRDAKRRETAAAGGP